MIQINLLPVREAKRQATVRKQGILLGLGAGAGLIVAIGLNLTVNAQARAKQAEIVQAQAELAKLQETRKEVEKYRKEKEEIERKLLVISRLEENRTGQVRILDEIAERIPERMWLEELNLQGNSLSLKGVSIDAEIVAEFLTALSGSELFRDVELDGTTVKDSDGLRLNVFGVRSRIGVEPEEPQAQPGVRRN